MQSQPNPLDGERPILGETHCDRCGAPQPPFDDEGLCRGCHKQERYSAEAVATASLEFLEAAVDTALDGNLHVDDVRDLVEAHTRGRTGARWTLDQLHTELKAIRDEEGAI